MSAKEKRLQKMAANPRGDWTIGAIEAVCQGYGIEVRRPGGSHVTISHPSQDAILTIPAHRPIKPIYIRRFVDFVRGVERSRADDG